MDQMQWDPSVKALTAFPSVLGNMDKNLSWTSTLGDAYYNQEQDVMDASSSDAPESGTGGQSEEHTAANGYDPGINDHHSTCGSRCCVCSCLQSLGRVRAIR